MDDIVKAAMAKWPNVPACHGWLALDARGQWWMRDDTAQAAGPFAGPGATGASRGARLQHTALLTFIGRNYAADAQGRWFFQNGPQRVYVELEAAPWVWRIAENTPSLVSHTGIHCTALTCWLDELGRLYLDTPMGLGLVHTQDMVHAAARVESGDWIPQECEAAELENRFGFVKSPAGQVTHPDTKKPA